MAERYAVVRTDRKIPGGLRIVGRPWDDEATARAVAAESSQKREVLPLSEVYRRRAVALGNEPS